MEREIEDPRTHIEQAEREIARVLQRLESATGRVVTGINIQSLEVTKLDDPSKSFLRNVFIFTIRADGSKYRF